MGVGDHCPECGTTLVTGARFCHACGASTEVTLIDLSGGHRPRPEASSELSHTGQLVRARTPRLAVGAGFAVAAALVGLVVVANGDDGRVIDDAPENASEDVTEGPAVTVSPSPSAVDPSPTGPVESSAPGSNDAVVVERAGSATTVLQLDGRIPLGLATTSTGLYLLAGEPAQATPVGLPEFVSTVLWHSLDGEGWEALGPVGEPGETITALNSHGDELVLAGTSSVGEVMVLRSADGANWSRQLIPLDDHGSGRLAYVAALAIGADELAMIALQRPALTLRLPDPMPSNVSVDWDGSVVQVRGPLGLELARYEPSQLDMSVEAIEASLADGPDTGAMLIAGDGSAWDTIESRSFVEHLTHRSATGEFVAVGASDDGEGTFRWRAGEGWTLDVGTGAPSTRQPRAEWGTRSVAVGNGDILIEGPRLEWVNAGLRQTFADAEVEPVDVLIGGQRLIVTTFGFPGSPAGGRDRSTSVVAIVDGGTVAYDPATGQIEVEAGGRRTDYPAWAAEPGDDYVVDLPSGTITFLDDADGTSLLTTPYATLEVLQARSFFTSGESTVMRVLSTFDASTWTIGPPQRSGYPAHAVVHDDTVLVATWGLAGEGLRVNRITLPDR